jgi:hypothetical protein
LLGLERSHLYRKMKALGIGVRWSRVAVFNMIPRLIEVGPRFFNSEEWEKRRQKFSRAKSPEAL